MPRLAPARPAFPIAEIREELGVEADIIVADAAANNALRRVQAEVERVKVRLGEADLYRFGINLTKFEWEQLRRLLARVAD